MKKNLLLITFFLTSHFLQGQPTKDNTKLKLGIGFFTDSISNISFQYMIYDMVHEMQLKDENGNKISPVLSLRRGTSDYYINGKLNCKPLKNGNQYELTLKCNVWHSGKLLSQFSVLNDTEHDKDGIGFQKEFCTKLSSIVSNNKYTSISGFTKVQILPDNSFSKKYEDYIMDNILPKDHYLKEIILDDNSPLLGTKYSYLIDSSRKYNNLHKYDVPFFVTTLYKGDEVLLENKIVKSKYLNFQFAEKVNTHYNARNLNIFFFNTGYIDNEIKEQAKRFVLPLWKRPEPIEIYFYCGASAFENGNYDMAIEYYNSGLLMVNNVVAKSGKIESLKYSLFLGLDSAYRRNNQGASAFICQGLILLHKGFQSSATLRKYDDTITFHMRPIYEFLDDVETNASRAKRASNSATFNSIMMGVGAAVSTVNDAHNGLTSTSSQTQYFMQQSGVFMNQSFDAKSASLEATAKAGEVFNKAFGDISNEFYTSKDIESNKPFLAFDFIQILSNKALAFEQKDAILKFSDSIPAIKDEVRNYYNSIYDGTKLPEILHEIYKKIAQLEVKIYSKEAAGKATDESLVTKNN